MLTIFFYSAFVPFFLRVCVINMIVLIFDLHFKSKLKAFLAVAGRVRLKLSTINIFQKLCSIGN